MKLWKVGVLVVGAYIGWRVIASPRGIKAML